MYDDTAAPLRRYRCFMRTRAGMYAQYQGHVDVLCSSAEPEELRMAAVRELRRTSFPDYSASMWHLERVELLH